MPNLLQRFRSAIKARMFWPGTGGANAPGFGPPLRFLLPGAQFDYEREVQWAWLNSAVANCLNFICTVFPEPELIVEQRQRDGQWKRMPTHPLLDLLARPNDAYDQSFLWAQTLFSFWVDGNGYWMLGRDANGYGLPKQVWSVPYFTMAPQWGGDGGEFIGYYLYRPYSSGQFERLEVPEVVHFRNLPDLHNPRHGWSPVKAALREVFGDNEMSTAQAALWRNFCMPGLMVSPANPESTLQPEEAQALKEKLLSSYTGENRGKPLVPSWPMKVEKLGWSPGEMVPTENRHFLEERISGAFGLPAIVAGLGAGLERATYANYEAARAQALRSNIMPTQRALAAALTLQLLPRVGGDPDRERVGWDYSGVAELQEDQDKLWARAGNGYKDGLIMRNEGRALISFPPVKEQAADAEGGGVHGGFVDEPCTAGEEAEKPDEAAGDTAD